MNETLSNLKIGDCVEIFAKITFGYDKKNNRELYTEKCTPFKAQITGGTYKPMGKICPASGTQLDFEETYFARNGSVFVYTAKRGFTNKDVYVLPKYIGLVKSLTFPLKTPPEIPFRYSKNNKQKGG